MAEKLLPRDACEKNAPKMIPPLAGFWFRFGALAIDIFLLRLAIQLTYPIVRPFYLEMGSASTAVVLLFVFFYLFLAEGPVGKGMTLGKAVLGVRTTDLRGETPESTAAAVRALFLLVLAMPFLGGQIEQSLASEGKREAVFAARTLTYCLPSAFILANVFLVVLHPLKQTVHDMFARTLVLRESGSHNLSAFMGQIAEQAGSLQRRAINVALLAFVAFGALNIFLVSRDIFSDEAGRAFRFLRSFDKEMRFAGLTPHFQPALFYSIERRLERDGLTSSTWATHLGDEAGRSEYPSSATHVLVIELQSKRQIDSDGLATSESLSAYHSRAVEWAERQIAENRFPLDSETRIRRGKERTIIFQPRYLALFLVEQVNLVLFKDSRVVWADILPLDLPPRFYDKEKQAAGLETTQSQTDDRPTGPVPVAESRADGPSKPSR